jgi:hypothetical protein
VQATPEAEPAGDTVVLDVTTQSGDGEERIARVALRRRGFPEMGAGLRTALRFSADSAGLLALRQDSAMHGSNTSNDDPWPGSLSTWTLPPLCWTMP